MHSEKYFIDVLLPIAEVLVRAEYLISYWKWSLLSKNWACEGVCKIEIKWKNVISWTDELQLVPNPPH